MRCTWLCSLKPGVTAATYRAVLALICMLFVPIVCGITDSFPVPGPLGCRLDVSRLDTSILRIVGNGP
jgi:hypothetical protein